jgi:hypothetical protein
LGWCRAETLTNRNTGPATLATARSAHSICASNEVGEVTPKDCSQWLSANIPGRVEPSGVRLLKNPTPPMQMV